MPIYGRTLTKKIPSTKINKSQITKHKYQTNYNDQNSKSQTVWVIEKLRFEIYLEFDA
jgi:hypothetical protein